MHHPLAAQKTVLISNYLYGVHVLSAYKVENGFTRQIYTLHGPFPTEHFKAHAVVSAQRKLAKILSSKSIAKIPLAVGDLVDIYVRTDGQKRGKWFSRQSVLEFDRAS